ncbi:tetratricopeptide repeat protein [Aliikangiella sp. G2MR2-5]|uniref:tetratricopeptide repeat protein n=1 Tax=Aliikangiella sp. G2MR2-5 TaxID=2788943 RepID=UPI0018AC4658|nr:tetratricopeptide repeat protein [Aliikangiella sp. G2MR2-5]
MTRVWEEAKTRKIFKAATYYAAITWGIIQISDILFPVLGVDDWVLSSMVLLAFAGFPVALISGWMYDIRLDRQKLLADSSELAKQRTITVQLFELVVILLFGASATFLYYNSAREPVQASDNREQLESILKPIADQKTIAVLPFASFSNESNDEFFADGLSEELLNVLARNKKLRVAARTSSFQYKNTNINVRQIAKELGVQYILEGSVRRSGDLIRVTAQLIKADEDVHVFSRSWDRDTKNVFKVQDEIANSVMKELKISLLGESEIAASEIGTKNIDAFAEYSKGLAFLRNRGKEDFSRALTHFNQALSYDPEYAEAMAMIAETYLLQVSYGIEKFEDVSPKAIAMLDKAQSINSDLGEAFAVKGLYYWQKSGHLLKDTNDSLALEALTQAKKALTQAININPSNAEAYMWYGSILQNEGNFVDGAALRKKAYKIDPQAAVVGFNHAQDLIRFGDYKAAMDVFNLVVRNNPNYPQAYSIAGNVSRSVGQLDQAYSMYRRQADLSGEDSEWLAQSTRILISMRELDAAQTNVDTLVSREDKYADKYRWLQAFILIAAGDIDGLQEITDGFNENTQKPNELLMRGYVALRQGKNQQAIQDLTLAQTRVKQLMPHKSDEETVRINLLLARAYQNVGNLLKADGYISLAEESIIRLRNEGVANNEMRYAQSVIASLKGETEKGITFLRQAIQEGFVDLWWAEADPGLTAVREHPSFTLVKDEFNIRMNLMKQNIVGQHGEIATSH